MIVKCHHVYLLIDVGFCEQFVFKELFFVQLYQQPPIDHYLTHAHYSKRETDDHMQELARKFSFLTSIEILPSQLAVRKRNDRLQRFP